MHHADGLHREERENSDEDEGCHIAEDDEHGEERAGLDSTAAVVGLVVGEVVPIHEIGNFLKPRLHWVPLWDGRQNAIILRLNLLNVNCEAPSCQRQDW